MGFKTVFEMKEDMMIVALDAVENEIMKIELVPLVITEKKMDLVKLQEEMLSGKDSDFLRIRKELRQLVGFH